MNIQLQLTEDEKDHVLWRRKTMAFTSHSKQEFVIFPKHCNSLYDTYNVQSMTITSKSLRLNYYDYKQHQES